MICRGMNCERRWEDVWGLRTNVQVRRWSGKGIFWLSECVSWLSMVMVEGTRPRDQRL